MSVINVNELSIRFVGDSGDGIQLIGSQFSVSSIESGNDIYTFVEFPAEIKAPAGSLSGVSVFQVCISSEKIYAISDKVDILVAMNPAALSRGLLYLKVGGFLVIDNDTFKLAGLKLAGYSSDPLLDGTVSSYRVVSVPITSLTFNCVEKKLFSISKAKKCRNFFALGIVYWLCSKSYETTLLWLDSKFKKHADLLESNKSALIAGYNYGDNLELSHIQYNVLPFLTQSRIEANFKKISGNDAIAFGALAASIATGISLFSANYPITPASDIFHKLVKYNSYNFKIIQVEDEISAIMSIIGASYGGALSFTCTSGPGLDLMQEGLGLAVMAELPIILIDVQRSGPSTGMPTKSEQTDLLAAVFGRHGECPVIVLAPNSPINCFWSILEGFYLSCKYATPLIILSDANIANSTELWELPSEDVIRDFIFKNGYTFKNRLIDFEESSSRTWINPVNGNLQYCIGGLEKDRNTGEISYDPINHFNMVKFRNKKFLDSAIDFDKTDVIGNSGGNCLIVTWGSVFGLVKSVHKKLIMLGHDLSMVCLRYLNPFPNDLSFIISSFKKILVIEENVSQLSFLLKSKYLINVIEIFQVTGRPFSFNELEIEILKNV
ncbi:MAG TPA: 2-oxoacid:acceptor oxidoreductase subunit alpha [Candidatus Azoamicus sp. OHIO1]